MSTLIILYLQPFVKVILKLFQVLIDFLAKSDAIKLIEYRLVKGLADVIRLRASNSRFGVPNLMVLQEDLVGMFIRPPTELCTSISEYICSSNRYLCGVELTECHSRVGVNDCLLIDSAYPFKVTHVECVLGYYIARVLGLDFVDIVFLLAIRDFKSS